MEAYVDAKYIVFTPILHTI